MFLRILGGPKSIKTDKKTSAKPSSVETPQEQPKGSQTLANMPPTWTQDGAMLGSKTVPRGQKTNRVAGWGRVVVGVGRRGGQEAGKLRAPTWGKVK